MNNDDYAFGAEREALALAATYANAMPAPDGWECWIEDEAAWCFCAFDPAGHPNDECYASTRLRPICPCCREVAEVRPARGAGWVDWSESRTVCCGERAVRGDGAPITDLEELR